MRLSTQLVVSPFYLLVIIYVVANVFSGFVALDDGGMTLEGKYFTLSENSILWAMCSQLIVIIFFVFLYIIFKPSKVRRNLEFGNGVAAALVFLQVIYMLFNIYYGVNIAGAERSSAPNAIISYLFVFLQPDILFCMVAVCLRSTKFVYLNIAIYLVSTISRGWMGGVLIVAVLVFCRFYPVKLKLRNLFFLALVFVAMILMLPFLIEAKWVMRMGEPVVNVFARVSDFGYFKSLEASVGYVANRLQHVGHVALLADNSSYMYREYELGRFLPYWMDGLPQYTFQKVMGVDQVRINTYMVSEFFDVNDPTWNTNPGLAGWFFVLKERSVLYVLYILCLICFPFYYVARYAGSRLFVLLACFAMFYLFHGWVGSYFNFAMYAMLVAFVSRLRVLTRPQSPDHLIQGN